MEPRTRLLDLSRLVSRVGRPALTGIDRVEAAYLKRFLADEAPLFALVRSSFGFTLFDRAGVEALAARLFGDEPWGPPDLLTKIFLKPGSGRRGPEADLRRLAVARSGRRIAADRVLHRQVGVHVDQRKRQLRHGVARRDALARAFRRRSPPDGSETPAMVAVVPRCTANGIAGAASGAAPAAARGRG